jgi:hypothetical protein
MERLEVIFMKKVISRLQDEFKGNDTANGIDNMFSGQPVHPTCRNMLRLISYNKRSYNTTWR